MIQLISEKIGGAKGTELEGEFHIMERRTDVIYKLIDDVRDRTNEFLQPNPGKQQFNLIIKSNFIIK